MGRFARFIQGRSSKKAWRRSVGTSPKIFQFYSSSQMNEVESLVDTHRPFRVGDSWADRAVSHFPSYGAYLSLSTHSSSLNFRVPHGICGEFFPMYLVASSSIPSTNFNSLLSLKGSQTYLNILLGESNPITIIILSRMHLKVLPCFHPPSKDRRLSTASIVSGNRSKYSISGCINIRN